METSEKKKKRGPKRKKQNEAEGERTFLVGAGRAYEQKPTGGGKEGREKKPTPPPLGVGGGIRKTKEKIEIRVARPAPLLEQTPTIQGNGKPKRSPRKPKQGERKVHNLGKRIGECTLFHCEGILVFSLNGPRETKGASECGEGEGGGPRAAKRGENV